MAIVVLVEHALVELEPAHAVGQRRIVQTSVRRGDIVGGCLARDWHCRRA
jgi:hypothetical protein